MTDAHCSHLVSDLNGLVYALSSDKSSAESACESVTCTVGIDNLVVAELADLVDLGLASALDDDGAVGSLGDDDHSRSAGVGLVESCELLGDLGNVGNLQGRSHISFSR